LRALDGNLVATWRDIDTQPVLDQQQVFVMLAEHEHEQAVVIKAQCGGAAGGRSAGLTGGCRLGLKRPWAQRALNS
jgi:hypothetical protein